MSGRLVRLPPSHRAVRSAVKTGTGAVAPGEQSGRHSNQAPQGMPAAHQLAPRAPVSGNIRR